MPPIILTAARKGFFKLCEDCGVLQKPHEVPKQEVLWDPSAQGWSAYIGPDSMTRIIEKSQGFTDVGLIRISESIRAYAYLILSSQGSARSCIIGNTASALTAQKVFLNNFENVVNCRVDIWKVIKCYQDTLSYTPSKVDYNMGEGIYMLPSNTNLNIRTGTAGYNNEILVSDTGF